MLSQWFWQALRSAGAHRSGLAAIVGTGLLAAGTSCGSSTDSALTPHRLPSHMATSGAEAEIVSRRAAVPPPSDKRERVVFTRSGSVWMARPSGADPVQLTVRSVDAPDEDPVLSPSGDRVAYASAADGVSKIYVLPLDSLIVEKITDGAGGGDRQPCFSPDGQSIAFMRGDPRISQDLFLQRLDGNSVPERILAGEDDAPELVGGPSWSPDGATIALSADRREQHGTGLWLVDLASKIPRRLLPPTRPGRWLAEVDPAFSPDGSRIAFASNRHVSSADHADRFDLYSVAVDGSGLIRLTGDRGIARAPSYSPDGKRLFFASTRIRTSGYEWEVFVMRARGGVQRRLTSDDHPENYAPSAGIAAALRK